VLVKRNLDVDWCKIKDGRLLAVCCLELVIKCIICSGWVFKEKADGVGVFVAHQWVDSVFKVKNHVHLLLIGTYFQTTAGTDF